MHTSTLTKTLVKTDRNYKSDGGYCVKLIWLDLQKRPAGVLCTLTTYQTAIWTCTGVTQAWRDEEGCQDFLFFFPKKQPINLANKSDVVFRTRLHQSWISRSNLSNESKEANMTKCFVISPLLTNFSLVLVSFFFAILPRAALAFLGEGYLFRVVLVNGNSPLNLLLKPDIQPPMTSINFIFRLWSNLIIWARREQDSVSALHLRLSSLVALNSFITPRAQQHWQWFC